MSAEDIIEQKLKGLEQETEKAMEKVVVFQRDLFLPIWEKRRAMTKQIPGFWGTAISNCPLFGEDPSEEDIEAFDSLTDFFVEYDKAKPEYRKLIATFGKNRIFKNETLTKEFTIQTSDNEPSVISKSTIEYHTKKNNKRKATEDAIDDSLQTHSFLEMFADEDTEAATYLADDIFPNAVDFYQGNDEEDDEDDDEEIVLSSDEEEVEAPKAKKAKK